LDFKGGRIIFVSDIAFGFSALTATVSAEIILRAWYIPGFFIVRKIEGSALKLPELYFLKEYSG
jgi:hypothetical protein